MQQDLLHQTHAGRRIIHGAAVVQGAHVGRGRGVIRFLLGSDLFVVIRLQLLFGHYHVLDGLLTELVQHLGVLIACFQLFAGIAHFGHAGFQGSVQLVTGEFRIGKLLALQAALVAFPIGVHRFGDFRQLLLGKLIQAQLLRLQGFHGVLHQHVHHVVLGLGDDGGIGGIIAIAQHAVQVGHVVQLVVYLVQHFAFGVHNILAAGAVGYANHFRGAVHGLILFDQGATGQKHGYDQHARQKSLLVHFTSLQSVIKVSRLLRLLYCMMAL